MVLPMKPLFLALAVTACLITAVAVRLTPSPIKPESGPAFIIDADALHAEASNALTRLKQSHEARMVAVNHAPF